MDLQWQVTSRADCPSDDSIRRWAAAALLTDTADPESEVVTIRIVDEEEMLQANGEFRGKHKATNVLSFPADLPAEIELEYLGDILICAPVVQSELRLQRKSVDAHWSHMVIHGMLHLQGYDHIDEQQAGIMEGLETQILARLGFPDPYCSDLTVSVTAVHTTDEVKQS
ncbi:rRNA maturation RNase YbeY [Chromatiales bacterium (ex Bugula neritina AB1)]|nr:rRNA maturation RNase YbeY [Chromatiales bacterium (ex Bugula neritina AB1)]